MKLNIKLIVFSAVFVGMLFTTGNVVSAYNIPDFPACSNVNGTKIADYSDGTHGIVGNYATYRGSDKVYRLDNGNNVQCFCATDGKGIQTNWWKYSSLTASEIQTLENLGWNYVPDGSLWGLDPVSYMTINENYNCKPENVTASVQSSSNSVGQVLGWASTGNESLLFALLFLGLASISLGKILKKRV